MNIYRKQYLCACEGQQEKMYLEHLAKLLKNFPIKVVTFNCVVCRPSHLASRYENYDRAALFDHDLNDIDFRRNIELCSRLNRQKKKTFTSKQKTYHAYSNLNFDLWLILHKEMFSRSVIANDAYVDEVRRVFGLKSSEDIKLQATHKRILEQISLADVKSAIKRADEIRRMKLATDEIRIQDVRVYTNPDFSIQDFLKEVLIDCGEW